MTKISIVPDINVQIVTSKATWKRIVTTYTEDAQDAVREVELFGQNGIGLISYSVILDNEYLLAIGVPSLASLSEHPKETLGKLAAVAAHNAEEFCKLAFDDKKIATVDRIIEVFYTTILTELKEILDKQKAKKKNVRAKKSKATAKVAKKESQTVEPEAEEEAASPEPEPDQPVQETVQQEPQPVEEDTPAASDTGALINF